MIATALIFCLGALCASLIALLFVPLVWRRAQRLARREFDATIPTSVNEIRAEMDLVRATSAFSLRREERRAREVSEKAARERGEAGRVILENGHLLARQKELEETLTQRDMHVSALDERLRAVVGERDELLRAHQELRARLQGRSEELEALALRHQALKERAAEDHQRLGLADAHIAKLEEALRLARAPGAPTLPSAKPSAVAPPPPPPQPAPPIEAAPIAAKPERGGTPRSGSERLRAVLKSRADVGTPAAPLPVAAPVPMPNPVAAPASFAADGNENAEIRERISDIAARVIQKEIETEGANSPLRALIEQPEPVREGAPSLASRVRALLSAGEASPGDSAPSREAAPMPAPAALLAATTPDAPPAPAPTVVAKPASGAAKRNGGGRSRPKSRR
ncbi:hypothetical protein [Aureimonas ureilytica]|uniref:hypothetical protein n=1 Tax=Aureimonas ureilytica TaxID=401562 RepID=UPI0003761313|nr:hypothetical protein [Aureimonas ureilytica]